MSDHESTVMAVGYATRYKECIDAIAKSFDELKRFIADSEVLYEEATDRVIEDMCSLAHFDGIAEAAGSQIILLQDLLDDFIKESTHHLLGAPNNDVCH